MNDELQLVQTDRSSALLELLSDLNAARAEWDAIAELTIVKRKG